MAVDAVNAGPGEVPCPDPSVHEKHQLALSEQASTAALYVTHPERNVGSSGQEKEHPLGPDGKLSSKSAAASLKYAKATDLPSFPSSGNTADSAGKAAMLAKDYKMKELWQPELSTAGSKAALLAHGKGGKLDLWQASPSSDGHSAATLAMRNKGLSPNVDHGVTPEDRSKALLAATKSHHSGRQRAESTPQAPAPAYPDSHNSGANALNAATVSHRASSMKAAPDGWESEANQAARIKNLVMDRNQFTDHPDIDVGNEEAKRQQALRASAVSMAKRIYESQNRSALTDDPEHILGAQAAAQRSSTASGSTDLKAEAMKYISLQETAHKLAAERLAKVDKNFEDARYREYYGYGDKPKNRLSSNMSMRSKGRGRAHKRSPSDVDTADFSDSDDEEQARRIRTQMSALQGGLSKVDEKKQQDDRAKVLAAAEKRVSQRMHNMDEKVYHDTGKIPPSLMEEWETKARERAQKERELQAANPGKTHIGGGKFMDQSEIEAIAAARLKPTLDEINDTAEKKRARDEEIRATKEEQERQKREDKAQKQQEKEEARRQKNEDKAAAKQQKEEERARKSEDKRKSREVRRDETGAVAAGALGGAGGAALATEEAEDEATTDPVQKHRSALGRLKERFRRSQVPASEQREEEELKTAPGTATATGAVTGATLDEAALKSPADPDQELDQQQAAHAVAEQETSPVSPITAEERDIAPTIRLDPVPNTTDATEVGAVATTAAIAADHEHSEAPEIQHPKPQRPAFEQKPSLIGFRNDDNFDSPSTITSRHELERHITQVVDSDDDDDDEDWNDEREERKPQGALGTDKAQVVADRVGTAPVVAEAVHPPIPTNDRTDETLAQLHDQRAEPPKDLPSTLDSPGVPKPLPSVETETSTATAPVETATELEKKPTKSQEAAAIAISAATAGTSDVTPEKLAAKQSKSSNEAAAKSPSSSKLQKNEKESKGVRGFFSKLRSKDSKSGKREPGMITKSDSKSVPSDSTKTGDRPATAETVVGAKPELPPVDTGAKLSSEAHIGTDGVIGDKDHVSGLAGNPGPESPSSFKRGESALNDPDDVSSSGADEDDVARGRGGRFARKLGIGKGKEAETSDRQNSNTEDEQFEEARDHFDENLAPPPAFAGQAKSESPVRETKFQEEL